MTEPCLNSDFTAVHDNLCASAQVVQAVSVDWDSIVSVHIQAYRLPKIYPGQRMGISYRFKRSDGEMGTYAHQVPSWYSPFGKGLPIKEVLINGPEFRAKDVQPILKHNFSSGKTGQSERLALRTILENFKPTKFNYERHYYFPGNYVDYVSSFAIELNQSFAIYKDGDLLLEWLQSAHEEESEMRISAYEKGMAYTKRGIEPMADLAASAVPLLSKGNQALDLLLKILSKQSK